MGLNMQESPSPLHEGAGDRTPPPASNWRNTMSLPEHELSRHCHHEHEISTCEAAECEEMLLEMESAAAREQWEEYAETGDDLHLTEIDRAELYI